MKENGKIFFTFYGVGDEDKNDDLGDFLD